MINPPVGNTGHYLSRSDQDDRGAYSVNEPAIDYNAPLVFAAGWLAYGEAISTGQGSRQ